MYLKISTMEYPLGLGDMLRENPGLESDSVAEGWALVEQVQSPSCEIDERVTYGTPVFENGKWFETWVIEKISDEELQARLAPETTAQKLFELGFTPAQIEFLISK